MRDGQGSGHGTGTRAGSVSVSGHKTKAGTETMVTPGPNPYKSVQSQVMTTATTPALHRADHSYNEDVKEGFTTPQRSDSLNTKDHNQHNCTRTKYRSSSIGSDKIIDVHRVHHVHLSGSPSNIYHRLASQTVSTVSECLKCPR